MFVQSDGDAELIVRDRTLLGFVIVFRAGAEHDAEFSYRVVAELLGFERTRHHAATGGTRTQPNPERS